MGLQSDLTHEVSHGPGADASDDAVADGLAGQVVTGPRGAVQTLGYGLQAGQVDELGPLHRGEAQVASSVALPGIGKQAAQTQVALALAGPPDGGRITTQWGSEGFLPLTGSNPQDKSSTPNLIPRRRIQVSDSLQLDAIRRWDRQRFRLASSQVRPRHGSEVPYFR